MSPKKKDEVLPVNPLYAVGGKPKPMTQDEIASAFAPDEEEEQIEEPKQNIQATPSAIQPIIQQVSQVMKDLPSGPPVRRKKHKLMVRSFSRRKSRIIGQLKIDGRCQTQQR
jgi:hypothetical protein